MNARAAFVLACGIWLLATTPPARAQSVKAETGAVAIGGSVSRSTINIGVAIEKVEELVRDKTRSLEELAASQRDNIALLREKLDINERQVRAALAILGEANIPPEQFSHKLVDIAERFRALQAIATAQAGDDPRITALKAEAKTAVEAGELERADSLLAEVATEQARALTEQARALARLAVNAAETHVQRGDIALTRLRYAEAAGHFAAAAAVFPPDGAHAAKRIEYLEMEADALYSQGDEFGDNEALRSAIDRYLGLIKFQPRERVPLDWAGTRNNLGNALGKLGERESSTARLEEAVTAFRDALKERTRERVPLDWAGTRNNLGNALRTLGERERGTVRLEEAVTAFRDALKELTRERVPLDWAVTQNNLGNALQTLGERERGTVRLEEAVTAFRDALKELTRERVPLQWAITQNNLGNALQTLGARESSTARLEEAVTAYRDALKERTREREPVDWAITTGSQGEALILLAKRRVDAAMAKTAVAQIEAARDLMQAAGHAPFTAHYQAKLVRARALAQQIQGR